MVLDSFVGGLVEGVCWGVRRMEYRQTDADRDVTIPLIDHTAFREAVWRRKVFDKPRCGGLNVFIDVRIVNIEQGFRESLLALPFTPQVVGESDV